MIKTIKIILNIKKLFINLSKIFINFFLKKFFFIIARSLQNQTLKNIDRVNSNVSTTDDVNFDTSLFYLYIYINI